MSTIDRRLAGKTALITGGARGFGAAAARLFAAHGACVVIGDVEEGAAGEVVDEIRESGGRAHFVRTDVRRAADVQALVDAAVAQDGRLDIAVANAGVLTPAPVDAMTEDQFYREVDINLKGVWLVTKFSVPIMKRQGSGSLILTGSGAALRGSRVAPVYAATKGAVVMLGKSLAADLAADGVRCNVVCPGPVATDIFSGLLTNEQVEQRTQDAIPFARPGEPRDIANAMLFFASDDASWCTGAVLPIDGGFSV